LKELVEQNVTGKDSTPFLLARVSELTGGDSLASNIQLVLNNARLGSAIAINYCNIQQKG
jgi:pseudouridine-5'-phosphate glycosidase